MILDKQLDLCVFVENSKVLEKQIFDDEIKGNKHTYLSLFDFVPTLSTRPIILHLKNRQKIISSTFAFDNLVSLQPSFSFKFLEIL